MKKFAVVLIISLICCFITSCEVAKAKPKKGKEAKEKEWKFGSIEEVKGHSITLVPVSSIRKRGGYFSSSRSYNINNYLFIDHVKNTKKWLLPHNNYSIETMFSIEAKVNKKDKVAAFFYVIKKNPKKMSLALSLADASKYTNFLDDIYKFLGKKQIADQLLIYYTKSSIAYETIVSLKDFSIVKTVALPAFPGTKTVQKEKKQD